MGQVRREHEQSTTITANAALATDGITGRHAAAALVSPRTSLAAPSRGDEITNTSRLDRDSLHGDPARARRGSRGTLRETLRDEWRDAAPVRRVVGHEAGAGPRTSRVSAEMRVAAIEAHMA